MRDPYIFVSAPSTKKLHVTIVGADYTECGLTCIEWAQAGSASSILEASRKTGCRNCERVLRSVIRNYAMWKEGS